MGTNPIRGWLNPAFENFVNSEIMGARSQSSRV
jgi:hypothetical protein